MELIRAAHSSAFSVEIYQVLPHQALSLRVGDSLQLFYFFWSLWAAQNEQSEQLEPEPTAPSGFQSSGCWLVFSLFCAFFFFLT